MSGSRTLSFGTLLFAGAIASACTPSTREASETASAQEDGKPFVQAGGPEAAGRYLAVIAGCTDCHTAGWVEAEGDVPEEQWLLGNPVGWRGPWGTTYAPNLRLTVQRMTEDEWVEMFRTRTGRRPMPWPALRPLADSDLRALYRYIKSLGPAGEPGPDFRPPGEEPTPPYLDLVLPQQDD